MAIEIFKLMGSIFINNEEADKSIRNTGKESEALQGKMSDAFGKIGGFALGAGTALAGAAVGIGASMLSVAGKTAEYADEIDKLSERTGINREELQRWKYAAGQSGADVGKLEVGIKKLSEGMNGAVEGSKSNIEAFEKLGITVDDLKGKTQEEIFDKVMTGLADMEQGAARNALGNDLLGKSYTELMPLLNAGAEGMQGLKDRADDLGLVMSEEAVGAGVLYGDTMDDVKSTLDAMTNSLGSEVMPIIQKFLDYILENMPAIQETFKGFSDGLKTAFGFIVENVIPPLTEGFQWLIDNMGLILPILATIGIAMGVFNVVTVIMGLVQAFKAWQLATEGMSIAQAALNLVMSLNPVALVIIAIAALVAGLILLWNSNEDFRKAMINTWEKIKEVAMPIIDKVISIFQDLWDKIKPIIDELLPILEKAFTKVFDNIKSIVGVAIDLVKNHIDTIIKVFNGLIDFVKNVFTGNWRGAWDAVVNIFGDIFKGIKEMFKIPINWVIDGINSFLNGINGIKIPDWVPLVGGASFNIPNIPRLKIGIDNVPHDDFPALLHKGERVLTAQENRDGVGNGTTIINQYFYGVKEEKTAFELRRELERLEREKVI